MFLIDNDEFEFGHGGQHSQTRAQNDACCAQMRCQPTVKTLRRCHGAVHGDDGGLAQMGKALAHPCFQLGREVDLGHQQQDLGLGGVFQHLGGAAQIHLSFAAAGVAMQQKRAGVLSQFSQHLGLFRSEGRLRSLFCADVRQGFETRELALKLQRRHVAQGRRQAGHGKFTGAALVIVGSKVNQFQPMGRQRGDAMQNRMDGFQGMR